MIEPSSDPIQKAYNFFKQISIFSEKVECQWIVEFLISGRGNPSETLGNNSFHGFLDWFLKPMKKTSVLKLGFN